jgi:LacI family transcriptional regulator
MADNKKEKVGVQDIADILNISASTVSRALNDHPRISRETKDKVWQVAKRLGYFSGIPEFSSPTKSDAVTILVPSLRSAFYIEVIEGIRDHFEKNGFNVFVLDTRNDDAKAADFFKKYKNYGTSGVIHIVCNRNIPAGFYSIPLSEALPVVSILEAEHDLGVSSVLPDMFHGIYNSLEHLKLTGIKRISLLLEHEACPLDHQIVSSFKSAMETVFGSAGSLSVFYSDRDEKNLKRITSSAINSKTRPEVMFVKDMTTAFVVNNEFSRAGINVPGDVMLITIDTVSGVKQLSNNMSILKLPAYDMGQKAAEMLSRQIQEPLSDKKMAVITSNFILKGSTMRF